MNSVYDSSAPSLDKFMRWWGAELIDLIPEQVRAMFWQSRECLLLTLEHEALEVNLIHGEERRALGRFAMNEEGREACAALLETQAGLRMAEVVLLIKAEHILAHRLFLPAATEENLAQVIAFEMDRYTPFKVDQVYYDFRHVKSPVAGKLQVDLVMAPRPYLDPLLEMIESWGLHPHAVDVVGGDAYPERSGYNLLPQRERPSQGRGRGIVNGLLGLLLLLIVAANVALPIWVDRKLEMELKIRLDQISDIAGKVQSYQKSADNLLMQTNRMLDKKLSAPVMVRMMEELTKRIPDGTWLSYLQYKGRRLQIRGVSPSASALIEIIEASPMFENTSFISPVTQDRKTNKEQFQIAADVVNLHPSTQSAQ